MATEDARYRQSSQFRLWSFSPAQISDLRGKTNELAKATISVRFTALRNGGNGNGNGNTGSSTPGGGDSSQGAASASTTTTAPPLPEFLTQAEEQQLINFYTVELLRAANFCELPTEVRATAAVFLRRFYVTNSIMTYSPTSMLKTALFFGAKSEGFYIRLNKIAEKFKGTTPEEILAGEFMLCEGIRFAFDVKHPYRALEGAIMELRRYGDIDDQRINEAHKRAREILKFSPLVTDAYFHYTPSQIMLAALSLADGDLSDRIINETFKHAATAPPSNTNSNMGTPAASTTETDAAPAPAAHPEHSSSSSKRKKKAELDRERIFGAEVRDRVLAALASCRDMLAAEPPERDVSFWGTKESSDAIKPLNRKLRRCRDPERSDLVALQKARRERVLNDGRDSDDDVAGGGVGKKVRVKKEKEDGDDGDVFGGGDVIAAAGARDPKRRKVSRAVDDPFGPAL